jgi:CRP-like cAMP-binding protein
VNFIANGLLATMMQADQALLLKKTQIVHFKAGDLLATPDSLTPKVFFIERGAVALFVRNSAKVPDTGLAVGLVGAEGALGLQWALNLGAGNVTLLVQSPGFAYVMDGLVLQQLIQRRPALLLLLSKYLWSVYEGVSALAAMAHLSDVKIRLAHWLVLSAKKCGPDPLVITHAHIAQMLGVRRATITLAAREMKMQGLISYSRGHIEIKKPDMLQRLIEG